MTCCQGVRMDIGAACTSKQHNLQFPEVTCLIFWKAVVDPALQFTQVIAGKRTILRHRLIDDHFLFKITVAQNT